MPVVTRRNSPHPPEEAGEGDREAVEGQPPPRRPPSGHSRPSFAWRSVLPLSGPGQGPAAAKRRAPDQVRGASLTWPGQRKILSSMRSTAKSEHLIDLASVQQLHY